MPGPAAGVPVEVCNPLLRTPLALIIDDSCPVVNLAYYWMKERHAWKAKHAPGEPIEQWEGDAERVDSLPRTIPADFARRWAEWCGEQGVCGKFSLIPYPAGIGRIDQGSAAFPDSPAGELDAWRGVYREVLAPNFDLTPEMLTHTHVVDFDSLGTRTWRATDEWEQVEWVDPPLEKLEPYIAAGMRVLKNVGIPADGVTSPGGFANRREEAYARAVLEASKSVNGDPRPFFFMRLETEKMPGVPIWHADRDAGSAIASIVGCTGDWFGGWTGWDAGSADKFITEDLAGGRLIEVLAAERPCILLGHWPGFYYGGDEVGFGILKEVKRRLDEFDPDGTRTLWMKCSQIGRYWMARELSEVSVSGDSVRVSTRFPTERFTLRISGVEAKRVLLRSCGATDDAALRSLGEGGRVRVADVDLRQVCSRRDFRSGTFMADGCDTFAAFDLEAGETTLEFARA